jgi:hypothetical protein
MLNQVLIKDERSVVGHFKTLGLNDSDMVYAEKQVLVKMQKMGKWVAYAAIFFLFIPLGLCILFSPGIFSFAFAGVICYFIFRKWKMHADTIKHINAGTARYCSEMGIEVV